MGQGPLKHGFNTEAMFRSPGGPLTNHKQTVELKLFDRRFRVVVFCHAKVILARVSLLRIRWCFATWRVLHKGAAMLRQLCLPSVGERQPPQIIRHILNHLSQFTKEVVVIQRQVCHCVFERTTHTPTLPTLPSFQRCSALREPNDTGPVETAILPLLQSNPNDIQEESCPGL